MKINSSLLFSNCLGIFQGGGCKAIAYVGAYKAACERGIGFSHVGGTSAGAIFAALIASGASPDYMEKIARSEDIRKIPKPYIKLRYILGILFVILTMIFTGIMMLMGSPCRALAGILIFVVVCMIIGFVPITRIIILHGLSVYIGWGAYKAENIEKVVSNWLHKILGKPDEKDITFEDLPLNLSVFSCDVSNNIIKEWSRENTPKESVAKAVAASCSIPLYFTPTAIKSEDGSAKSYHVDGGLLINRPDIVHNDFPTYFQALSFKLVSHSKTIKTISDYVLSLINTLILGADRLQHTSRNVEHGINERNGVNEVEISVGEISATEFSSLTEEIVDTLIDNGYESMNEFLEETDKKLLERESDSFSVSSNRVIIEKDGMDYILNQVAFWSYDDIEEIIVADDGVGWVWPMFPTLLSWIENKTKILVYYNKANDERAQDDKILKRHKAQIRLLNSLGISPIATPEKDLIKGFFVKKASDYKCVLFSTAQILENNKYVDLYKAKVYNGEIDSIFINKIIKAITENHENQFIVPKTVKIQEFDKKAMIDKLSKVDVYHKCKGELKISFEKIKAKDLYFIKRDVRSLKYKELRIIDKLYKDADLDLYTPAQLEFSDGQLSIMTPIIAEIHDGKLIVIKGNARCFKMCKEQGPEVAVPIFLVESGCLSLKLVYEDDSEREKEMEPNIYYKIDELVLSEKKNRGKVHPYPTRDFDQVLRPDDNYLK